MGRVARAAQRFLRGAVLYAGWLALLLAVVLIAAEQTGLVERFARDAIAARLPALADEVRVERARLRWFQLAVEIEGLGLSSASPSVRFDAVRLEFALFGPRGPGLARADVRGGRVRVTRALVNALQSLGSPVIEPTPASTPRSAVPVVRVADVDIELETLRFGVLPIGRIDAFLRGNEREEPELWGRMTPSFAASAAPSTEVYLHGKVREPGTFEVNATATHLPIGTDYLPVGSDLDVLRDYQPHGWLDLDLWAEFRLDGSVAPRARGRVSVRDGDALVAGGRQRLDRLQLDVSGLWRPTSLDAWADPSAWVAQLKATARLGDNPFEATAVLGPDAGPGSAAKAWIHAPRLELRRDLLEILGESPAAIESWNAFDARGACETWLGARLRRDFTRTAKLLAELEFIALARFDGGAGLTYRGFASATPGVYDGFPLPLDKVRGAIVFARDPPRLRPYRLGLLDLSGDGGTSLIRANGTVISHAVDVPPFAPQYGSPEFDVELQTIGLPVDDRLRKALAGLADALPPATTWEPFKPVGGKVDVGVRILRDVDMDSVALDLDLALHEVGLTWRELPVPILATKAGLRFRSDGRHARGLAFELDGTLKSAQEVRVAARLGTDPRSNPPAIAALDDLLWIGVDVAHASLTGDNRRVVSAALVDVGAVLDDMGAKGWADVHYERARTRAGGSTTARAEVTPRDPVQLTPKQFQMITSDVKGRVIVDSVEEGPADREGTPNVPRSTTRTRLAPLVGKWDQKVRVAFAARLPGDVAHVFGAGLDPASGSLLGSLRQAISSPSDSSPVDLSALRVEGQLDFTGEIALHEVPDARRDSRFRFFLRDNVLTSAEGFRLAGLSGELQLVDGELLGDRIDALLAETPIELRGTRFKAGADGFRLETRFDALAVPIDREHLAPFVDASTIDALVDQFQWKGSIDVRGGRLVLSGPTRGETKLEFGGQITPHDVSGQLGLPISIRSASATIEKLVYEGGRVRSVVRVEDVYGEIADRALGPASFLVTYYEPNLSVEAVTARFEGGDLGPLGADAERRGTVFSIGLEPPFPFQLALRLKDVEVAGLVRGLFPSNMATRGKLDLQARLVGDMDHLLGIVGSGSIRVLDSRLWSIPVFRALFAQLGLDDTAVFDSMAANLFVKDGRISMLDIIVRSPLLQLVGSGSLDFDGRIHHDLELRYEFVDRLGPVTRFLYFIQNQLLRVAIRGDMSRPEILLQNPLSSLFGSRDRDRRALPLPAFGPLPKRF